jgi:hypothetical protein
MGGYTDRPSMTARIRTFLLVAAAIALAASPVAGQTPAKKRPPSAPVQKIREGVYRIGTIEVDTTKKELTVPGHANDNVTILEFVANTVGGAKAYESAITVDTTGVLFNTALLLLGADPAHSRVPKFHFDPAAPKGDPLEIWIQWSTPAGPKRVRIEELLYDERTKTSMSQGPWVYTGSTMNDGRYMSDMDGVLIGFVHSPSPVIENPRSAAVGAYGSIVMNKNLGLLGGMNLVMTVKALPLKR